MKVALFGGSFDPPHRGHIALARLAIDRLGLDRVLFAPVGVQPFKGDESSPFAARVAMLRLALASQPGLEISLIDAPHADDTPNYTLDTVKRLRDSLDPADALYCLMGADSFLTIGKWHRSLDLLFACDFVVGSRPGFALHQIAAALPEQVSLAAEETASPGCLVLGLRGPRGEHSRLYLLPDLDEDISATQIRRELQAGAAAAVDPAVAAYIQERGLYRTPS